MHGNYDKIIFHIDVNSAFLSWSAAERLKNGDDIDLRQIPSIIGGDSSKRHGIVLAKSIPAKRFNINTAEPIANALRKCPTLVIESPNMELYRHNSQLLMDYLSQICPDLEQASIDECYMDFTSVAHMYSSYIDAANMIKDGIRNTFGFTVNIGISDKKVLAKMASDFEKPDKIHTLFSDEIKDKMWPLPISDLYMCGKSSVASLKKLGIRTIGDLACFDIGIITDNLKSQGQMLHNFANGIDNSIVETVSEKAKGIGNSTTLSNDIVKSEDAYKILLMLSGKVASRLRSNNSKGYNICVEIKYNTFKSVSHQKNIIKATSNESTIYDCACELFNQLWDNEPIRLLGIRVTKLIDDDEPYQLSIFDMDITSEHEQDTSVKSNSKLDDLDKAIDSIRNKYGYDAIKKGTLVKKSSD